jgi:quinol monooxygenase YgiN
MLTRKFEKGNIAFHLFQIIGNKTQFMLYERWKSKKDLEFHREQKYPMSYLKSLEKHWMKKISKTMNFLTV